MNQSSLRLSALRAFLGRIHPEMRLVKIEAAGKTLMLTVVTDRPPGDRVREDVSEAGAEIIAAFPQAEGIEERIEVVNGPIAAEDIFTHGWIFRRAEEGA